MEALGPQLKYRGVLERKRAVGQQAPVRMRGDGLPRLVIVGLEVGAKEEAAPLPCPRAELVQKSGLQKAVLVMPLLRPWIGKQNINIQQAGVGGEFPQQVANIAPEKMQIRQPGQFALSQPFADSLQLQIDANAELIGMRRGVRGQEVTVAAADLEDESRFRGGQICSQLQAQRSAAFGLNCFEDFQGHWEENLKAENGKRKAEGGRRKSERRKPET